MGETFSVVSAVAAVAAAARARRRRSVAAKVGRQPDLSRPASATPKVTGRPADRAMEAGGGRRAVVVGSRQPAGWVVGGGCLLLVSWSVDES